jgi:ATP-dependent DNA helicase 2 subunit 1
MADTLPYRSKGEDGANEENEEEDEEIDETGYKTVKDAVLFAIEVSESMLKKPPASDSKKADTNSPLLAALKCAYHLMQQRIISNPRDLMGILLYGTEASKFYDEDESTRGGWSFPHCYLLTDLNVPEADDVKELKQLVEDEDSDGVAEIFKPSTETVSMHTVLFCANQVFQQRASNFSSRRLFLVTDNDNPHANNKAFRSQATVRAKDLYDLGVIIELFPISTPDHEFDTKLFYSDIVYKASPSDPEAIAYNPTSITDVDMSKLKSGSSDGITLLQSLLSTVASKIMAKRALFSSVPLEIGPNLRISVKGYLLYKRQKPARSCYIYLESETPQIVKGNRTQLADVGEVVQKADIRKAYTFGGERIVFTEEEQKSLRDFGEPIIRIIGFKPLSKLPFWANIKNSTFLYPSEEDYVGSTRTYSALHRKLSTSSIFGLCWFIPRRNSTPVMAALIPTLSAPDTDSRNLAAVSHTGAPQGLHLIPLPFADDIRINPPATSTTPIHAPDTLVDLMRPIIQQLQLPKGMYDPNRYPNPSLQWHYRILQALALEEDLPSKPEDKTLPKYKQIDKRVGNETVEWGKELEAVYKQHMADNPDAAYVGVKRTFTSNKAVNGGPAKKSRAEGGEGVSEEEMRRLWQRQMLPSLTVVQLKEFCLSKKMNVGGKKADLVERVEAWFEVK